MFIITSIAPKNIIKQQAAINSWFEIDFDVVSINTKDEIAVLQKKFPKVQFQPTKRHGKELTGTPYIYIDDLLSYLSLSKQQICWIVNSDIQLQAESNQLQQLISEARDSFVYGSRVNIDDIKSKKGPMYPFGFDFFIFDAKLLGCYPKSSFMLGAPWIDHWLVINPILAGMQTKKLTSPFGYHLLHEIQWSEKSLHYLGNELSRHLIQHYINPVTTQFASMKLNIQFKVSNYNKLGVDLLNYIDHNSIPIKFIK